ncbi:MAG: ATP-binding protein [Treponema sp.]|jgi:predicted AAA+ superfamily ATPase|nr:ATP-binding protein [Treponema sp.]
MAKNTDFIDERSERRARALHGRASEETKGIPFIKRHAEKALAELVLSFPVILVTGPRQIGKSTLLQNTPRTGKIPYITFDDTSEIAAVKNDAKTFLSLHSPPVVFDEIQYVPELFPLIKLKVDKNKKKAMYFLTGSQHGLGFETRHLMKNISESLAGRIGILQLMGLSVRETGGDTFNKPFIPTMKYFTARKKDVKNYSAFDIWKMIHTGSFPAVVSGFSRQKAFYDSYIRTYIERDVRALSNVGNELQFMQFITVAANRTGQMVNFCDMARDVQISEPTAKKWLSILVTSGLVYLLPPFSMNVEKRVVKTPKLYFLDTGLAAYLTKWTNPDVLRQGAAAGAFFETFVVAEILKSYYNAGMEPSLYYYRDKDKKEIDLLIMENGTLYPLEIKMTATPKESDAAAFKVLKAVKGLNIGSGGLICTTDSLGIIGKDRYSIPAFWL